MPFPGDGLSRARPQAVAVVDQRCAHTLGSRFHGAPTGHPIVIGVVESLSGFYLPEGFKDIAPYVVVLVMLVVKPNGLFGDKLRKKV